MSNHGKVSVVDFVLAFLMPMIVGKIMVVYFGANYSAKPGEGYGVGLSLAIAFTLTMLGRFLWKYRNYDDEA